MNNLQPIVSELKKLKVQQNHSPQVQWAVIHSVSPLRIRLDEDTLPLEGTPQTLLNPELLEVGMRVEVILQNNRAIIQGIGGGFEVPEMPEPASQAEVDAGVNTTKYVTPKTLASAFPPKDYSLTEQDTGRKWVDGKPIYQRTFQGTITQSAGVRNFLVLLSGVSDLVDASGFFTGSDGHRYAICSVTGNDNLGTIWHFSYVRVTSGNNLDLVTRSDQARTNAPYKVTVLYTKV